MKFNFAANFDSKTGKLIRQVFVHELFEYLNFPPDFQGSQLRLDIFKVFEVCFVLERHVLESWLVGSCLLPLGKSHWKSRDSISRTDC